MILGINTNLIVIFGNRQFFTQTDKHEVQRRGGSVKVMTERDTVSERILQVKLLRKVTSANWVIRPLNDV